MKKQSIVRVGVTAVAAAMTSILGSVSSLEGQQTRSLTFTETTRFEMPGTLGMFMRMAGGSGPTTTRTGLHLQGRVYIHETDESAFVMDLEEGRMLTIDHQRRSYQTMTFAEMAQFTEEMMTQARAEAAQAGAGSAAAADSPASAVQDLEESRTEIDFRISGDATGQRQRIGSYDAEQYVIQAEFEAKETPEGVEQPEGGTMYFVAELWQTDDVPGEGELEEEWARILASDPRFRELAEDMTEAVTGGSDQVLATSLAMWDPQAGAGLVELTEAMDEISGTSLRTVVVAAIAPLGVDVDRDELLAWEPSAGNTLGNAARAAARESITNAARGAIGGLLGGRGRAPEPEPEPVATPENTAAPLFRMTTTRDDISYRESNDDVYGDLKARIADYSVQTFEDAMRQPQ